MGRKNKKAADLGIVGDSNVQTADQSKGYVSQQQLAAQEAADAMKGHGFGSDSDEEQKVPQKKKNKRNKGAQELEDFDNVVNTNQPATEQVELDEDRNFAQEMEENFGGMSKKNTRKKKQTGQNMQDDLIADAFDEGADSDEIQGKKGKKNKNKKGKKGQQEQEAEEAPVQEETKGQAQNEDEDGAESLALNVVYCGKCGVPPEYCSFANKDVTACKQWLSANEPALFAEIYGEVAEEDKKEDEEEKKGESTEDGKPQKKKQNKKDGVIHVYKLKRGGKKVLCQMTGFEYYTKDLKGLASKFGKKFSCGCNVAQDDIYGECISVQGDVEDRLLELMETDKDLLKLEIPFEKIEFEDKGNKKGRKQK